MGEVLVVGSGPGGATVAKELALRGKKVTILEKGHYPELGTEKSAADARARADASVLPQAPGLPPVVTIVALAKRLAKRLTKEYL